VAANQVRNGEHHCGGSNWAMSRAAGLTLLAYLALAGASSGAGESSPQPPIDMRKMYGGWYMIATIPNAFERGIVAPYDVYSERPDGDIQEDFTFRPGSFSAEPRHYTVHDWVLPNTGNRHWRVQVFWPINLPFLALYVDKDYRYVIFGEEDRQLGWIFSRSQTIPPPDYADLLRRFAALGYDPAKLVMFVQTPDQIGKSGYWSEGVSAAAH
jgi:apolipoprotein D and lipocalin family protein